MELGGKLEMSTVNKLFGHRVTYSFCPIMGPRYS